MDGKKWNQLPVTARNKDRAERKGGTREMHMVPQRRGVRTEYTAGVEFVMDNNYIQYIQDVEPVNDRLITMTIEYTMPITLISAYMPQAGRPEEEKHAAYDNLTKHYKRHRNNGPTYILGDMNARIQARTTEEEGGIIGAHTFEPETANITQRSDEVILNRELLVEFCHEHKLELSNTRFRKPNDKLATYEEVGTTKQNKIKRGTHEHIDFIIKPQRWRNSVLNAESKPKANIYTDNFPVIATLRIKLKATTTARNRRLKYSICNGEENQTLNEQIRTMCTSTSTTKEYLKQLQDVAKKHLPKGHQEKTTRGLRKVKVSSAKESKPRSTKMQLNMND